MMTKKKDYIGALAACLMIASQASAQSDLEDMPSSEILAEIAYLMPMRGNSTLSHDTISEVVAEIGLINFCEGKSRDDASAEVNDFRDTILTVFGGSFPDRIMPNEWNQFSADDCSSVLAGTGPVKRIFREAARQSMINEAIFARQYELQSRIIIDTDDSIRLRDIGESFEQRLDAIRLD